MRFKLRSFLLLFVAAALFMLSACDSVTVAFAPPSPTPTFTFTPFPPTATFTPPPTATETPLPPPTFTPLPPTLELPPTIAIPSATPDKDHAILVYYINKEQKGPYGCNEALWYLNTGQAKSDNLEADIAYALRTMLNYHNQRIGILYNPGYASNLAVSSVKVQGDGSVVVNLTGTYVRTDDPCDGPRFRDQLRFTIKQFPVTAIQIFINGATLGDTISRK